VLVGFGGQLIWPHLCKFLAMALAPSLLVGLISLQLRLKLSVLSYENFFKSQLFFNKKPSCR